MFTLQSAELYARLVDSGLPEAAATAIVDLLGQCDQQLEHRGPITLDVTLPPQANGAALTINAYGNYPADANPTTPTNGLPNETGHPNPGGQQFNPNGPAALVLNGMQRMNGPFILNGPLVFGEHGTLSPSPPSSGTSPATHSIASVQCGIVLDSAGRVVGGYNSSGTWYSPFGYSDPGLVGTDS